MENLVTCKFKGNEIGYVFKTYIAVKLDDLVVVDTINGFKLATVVAFGGELPIGKRLMEIVDVVDVQAYNERKEREEKVNRVKRELAKRAKEINKMSLYQALAKDDSIMRELLNQLDELNEEV